MVASMPPSCCAFVLPSLPRPSISPLHLLPRPTLPMATTSVLASFSTSPSPSTTTALFASPMLAASPLATAGASLLLSSTLGLLLERTTKPGRALGASLIAFLSQAVLSNFHLIPMDSPAYDACWGKVLPASLSLSVLLAVAASAAPAATSISSNSSSSSLPAPTTPLSSSSSLPPSPTSLPPSASSSSSSPSSRRQQWMETPLWKVTVANVFGALGALLGGLLAFHFALHHQSQFPRLVLAKIVASIATTHIGGSINFFQVARAVGLDQEGQGLLGAVAGADVFLMALYFAALLGMQRNPAGTAAFLRWGGVGGGKEGGGGGGGGGGGKEEEGLAASSSFSSTFAPPLDATPDAVTLLLATPPSSTIISQQQQQQQQQHRHLSPSFLPSLVALLLAFTVGEGGQLIEHKVGVPGMAAGTITALSIAVFGLLRRLSPRFFLQVAQPAGGLSSFLFSLFFAAIGAGASLTHLVQSGPVIVALMSLSLFIHLLTTLVGLRVYNRWMSPSKRVSVDEAVIGSNANVGGPATAAAMAGSIDRPDLVLPAAATGTGGYALATFVGVGLFRLLTK